ncbi:aminodeoxychorismate synthase component I [Staphylococcus shinii]|uniref:aminodeoxychorismate synthase component I n=1 Tax=Staphylococcus shinii TaxID=2912228 RepID=UPI00057C3424|nr:aminodeoxychorismate synthase component I [Staphylococcus shinii]
MQIHFNYRYITDEKTHETYRYLFTECIAKKIAYTIEEVGEVVCFAEKYQNDGYCAALYLPYEAATYFNKEMATVSTEEGYVYAAAYIFENISETKTNIDDTIYQQQCSFQFQLNRAELIKHIRTIQSAIVEGNTYQVNYTTRLVDSIHHSIATLYYHLLNDNHGFYSALIETDELQVASLSPELFFQRGPFKADEDILLSKPMKGTMPRGSDETEDRNNLNTLSHSSKDRAENVMIVDLLRNDMSRIAETGTVNVYKPFHIEPYQTVFQMTSMITAKLHKNTNLNQILSALFPCGSITGAPKLNTMNYIKALEQTPRNIYCGAIGLLLPNGKSIFNVPIRTIQYLNNQAIYGVGAGITIDSIPEQEVQEFIDKTKILERL